jgi:hypothetical protein
MRNTKSLLFPIKVLALIALYCLIGVQVKAQTTPAPEQVYIQREYMKVMSGMRDDYLKVEQVWKTVHQRRKDEGKILGWTLYRSIYPSGTNAEYDYMTTTRFKSGKELEDAGNMTWDYITKGMSKEDLAIADNTGKTRNLVATSLYYMTESASPGASFLKLTHLQSASGKGSELEKMEKMMKPVFEEAIKMGKIATWTFGDHMYPYSPETGNYYRVIGTNTLEDMLNADKSNYIEVAFKKVYPAKDYAATMKAFRDIIEIKSTELWVRVDSTK